LLLEPKPYQTHSLRTFWAMLLPWDKVSFGLYLLSAIIVLGLTIAIWKHHQSPFVLRYSSLLLATVLVAPHLTIYDLVILAPAILLLADWIMGQPSSPYTRRLRILLYLIYALPLIGPLARFTHLQLSVIAMSACLLGIWRVAYHSDASLVAEARSQAASP
jgi:hypothetical protein